MVNKLKTKYTCYGCIDEEGKLGNNCEIRESCCDDASTTEQRKEILLELPKVDIE
jgi:hypothetical protein